MRRLCLFFVAAALFIVAAPATWAQPSTGLILHQRPDGVEIVWTADQASEPQRLLLYLTADTSPSPVLRELQDQPLNRPLALPSLPTVVVDGEPRPPLPSFAPEPPTAPLRLLGEGYRQGMRLALYEISPYYRAPNGPRQALRLRAFVAGAMLAPTHHQPAVGLSSAPLPDPIATRPAWTIDVTAEGVQEIDAHTLRSLGLDLELVAPAQLRLYRAGKTLPLEPVMSGTSGTSVTALRFYAPPPGDRWSASDRYWLTAEPGASLNLMASRTAQPLAGDVPAGITVSGTGPDEAPTIYESTLAGFDGDYFFRRQLDASAGAPVSTTLTITPTLPFATSGPMQVTFELATLVRHSGTHRLRVTAGNGWSTSLEWSGHGSYRADITLPSPTTVLTLTLDPISGIDRIYLDRLLYQAPAQINLTSAGAIFSGQAGLFAYPLTGIAPGSAVYDISDPYQPVRLHFSGTTFADNAPVSRRYLVTGSATLHTPLVARHNPVDVTTPRQARAIYIAPRALIGELEPLLVRRQAQGWSPLAIAVEDVYAGWSGGEPDPRAIRDFLRYAAATWSPAPEAVILVGDGSSDPRDYLRRGWPTLIPPYLAEVDPWLGETACEACFAQLDGDDPTTETLFQADLWIGRLPVKTAEELRRLVVKLLAYDQSRGAWQRHAVYLADNPDSSGDFAAMLDDTIGLQPPQTSATRVYYNPDGGEGRIADANLARQQALAAFNQGAGLLVYAGHGLQFQWAFTDFGVDEPFLLNVDTATDLRNGSALPVVLSMTCLTGAFQHPSFRGTTIDEALVLNPDGGAIATWSSSGFGVAYGHRQLLLGFVEALWSWHATSSPPLGHLVAAGYAELAASGEAPASLRTFLLLGDPLTPVAARPLYRVDVPLVQR